MFTLLFMYFMLWALARPPFQSPDEFAHSSKARSVPSAAWMTSPDGVSIRSRYFNPLLNEQLLFRMKEDPSVKLTVEDCERMKAVEWPSESDTIELKGKRSAYSFPVTYYALIFITGQGLTGLLGLSPYASHYAFRAASALISALLWTLVYWAMGRVRETKQYRRAVFFPVVLLPMLAFMSSAVNADAMLAPVTALVMLYYYRALFRGECFLQAFILLAAAHMIKPAALILYPCILIICACLFIRRGRDYAPTALRICAGTAAAGVVCFMVFYSRSPLVLLGGAVDVSLINYIARLPWRVPEFMIMYHGRLGWLDYEAPLWIYCVLIWLVFMNAVMLAMDHGPFIRDSWRVYLFAFAGLFACGLAAGEFRYLGQVGEIIQGRYFLPVATGFAVIFTHRIKLFSWLYIAGLVVLNAALLIEGYERYCGSDVDVLLSMLPF